LGAYFSNTYRYTANVDSYEASNKEAYLHHQGVISFEKKMVKQIVEQHYQQ
jgi:hypothetical protein